MRISFMIIGALVIAGIVVYLLLPEAAYSPEAANEQTNDGQSDDFTNESALVGDTARGTFAGVLAKGGSGRCTFSNATEGTVSEGEFWYSDGKISVETVSRVDGEVYTSNMINDGDTLYIWGGTAEGTQAIMMDATIDDSVYESYATTESNARVDMEQEVDYTCTPWTPAAMQFVPPSDITFMDMQALMSGYFEGELRGAPEGMDF